jgi:hypothetical protein
MSVAVIVSRVSKFYVNFSQPYINISNTCSRVRSSSIGWVVSNCDCCVVILHHTFRLIPKFYCDIHYLIFHKIKKKNYALPHFWIKMQQEEIPCQRMRYRPVGLVNTSTYL